MPEHNHAEAFHIMTYACQDCGFSEKIWNSRDGVTPFCLTCPKCGSWHQIHVDWQKDIVAPDYAPPVGSRMFVDLPEKKRKKYGAPPGSPSIVTVK